MLYISVKIKTTPRVWGGGAGVAGVILEPKRLVFVCLLCVWWSVKYLFYKWTVKMFFGGLGVESVWSPALTGRGFVRWYLMTSRSPGPWRKFVFYNFLCYIHGHLYSQTRMCGNMLPIHNISRQLFFFFLIVFLFLFWLNVMFTTEFLRISLSVWTLGK